MEHIFEKHTTRIAAAVSDLTVAYGMNPVLRNINIGFPMGKLIAVMGPNGAGKSTLIKAMLGLVPKISGTVLFFPGEAGDTSLNKNRRRIAYVPQCGSVDWDFPVTALDVVTMGTYPSLGLIKRPGARERERAMEMLRTVGMDRYAHRQIGGLSGGQQQRLFIARALIQDADIYFLDEPFKGVDAATEKTVMELLRSLKNRGKTIIVVHHDLQTAPDYFDHIVFLNVRVRAQGDARYVFNEKNLHLVYGNGETKNG